MSTARIAASGANATYAATPARTDAGTAAAPATPLLPRTLTWDGSGSTWRDWVTPSLVGLGTGVAAGVAAKVAQDVARSSASGPLMHPAAPFVAGAVAFLAGTLITDVLRSQAERQPAFPTPGSVPSLPGATPPAGAPGHTAQVGRNAGTVEGDYWRTETYTETEWYTDSDGHRRSRQVTKTRQVEENFRYDLDMRLSVGRMDGYASADAALDDTRGVGPVAVVRDAGRFFLYRTDVYNHWGDVDRMRIPNPAVVAVMSTRGEVWKPGYEGGVEFHETYDIPDTDPVDGLHDDKVASYALDRRFDPDIKLYSLIGPGAGYATLGEALGDARARPGDDAVVTAHGRFYVMDTYAASNPDTTARLRGLRTGGSHASVAALEVAGTTYVASGPYWMTPTPNDTR